MTDTSAEHVRHDIIESLMEVQGLRVTVVDKAVSTIFVWMSFNIECHICSRNGPFGAWCYCSSSLQCAWVTPQIVIMVM